MTREAIFAACAKMPEGDGDDTVAASALADLGFTVRWGAWDDPALDFAAADVVVLRATWDYPDRRAEFVDWCETVPALCNPAPVVRWNTDKSYLVELFDAGVPTVPTTLVEPGEQAKWPKVPFVVKPSVGAGSFGVARFGPDATGAAQHLGDLHADGRTALIQPYQSSVDTQGEIALVYLGGVYSHAFTKGAMLGSAADPSGLFLEEKLAAAIPAPKVRAVAGAPLRFASAVRQQLA